MAPAQGQGAESRARRDLRATRGVLLHGGRVEERAIVATRVQVARRALRRELELVAQRESDHQLVIAQLRVLH